MVHRGLKILGLLTLLLTFGSPPPAQASFLDSIANGISSAANSVSSGLSTAATATSNGLNTAVTATGNGISTAVTATGNALSTAANATSNGLQTAANATSRWVTTAARDVNDAYNVSANAIRNFTSETRTALQPAAQSIQNTVSNFGNSLQNVSSSAVRGVAEIRNPTSASNSSSTPTNASTTDVDATSATSIVSAIQGNSTGFIQVANSILVALGQGKNVSVEQAIRNIINNQTGETAYPSAAVNRTVGLGLAEAVVTAFVTAKNYTVTVNVNNTQVTVNSSQVLDVFLAGLQDGLTPCAKNVSSAANATSGTPQYFSNIASGCCYLVAQPLSSVVVLGYSNGGTDDVNAALQRSQSLGQMPSLDLTRCVSNSTATS